MVLIHKKRMEPTKKHEDILVCEMLVMHDIAKNKTEIEKMVLGLNKIGSFLLKFILNLAVFYVTLQIYSKIANIVANLPDLRCSVLGVDMWGAIPALLIIITALGIYLRNNVKEILKIAFFLFFTSVLVGLFQNKIITDTGFVFDLPMMCLLLFFAFYESLSPFSDLLKKWKPLLVLIRNGNDVKEVFATTFGLIGFPLLLFDTIVWASYFNMAILGGNGLRDGLNRMVLTIAVYAVLLYGANKLISTINVKSMLDKINNRLNFHRGRKAVSTIHRLPY